MAPIVFAPFSIAEAGNRSVRHASSTRVQSFGQSKRTMASAPEAWIRVISTALRFETVVVSPITPMSFLAVTATMW